MDAGVTSGVEDNSHSHWILCSLIVLHCTSSSPAKSKTLPCQFIAAIPAVVSRYEEYSAREQNESPPF